MKEWAARLLLLAAGSVVALVGAEMYLRAFAPQPLNVLRMRADGVLLHEPNLDVTLTGADYRSQVRINSAGLRDVERPLRKPEGVTRLLVLGDSMVEGLQVELEQTLSKRLAARLAEAMPGRAFDAINAGVSGSTGPMARLYLEREGLAYDPDLVIVAITTRNDVQEAAEMREPRLPPGYNLRTFVRSRFHLYGLAEKAVNNAPRLRNALAALGILSPALPVRVRAGVSDEVHLFDGSLAPFEVLGYERLFKAYDQIIKACRERGVPVLFVIIPSYFQASGYAAALGEPGIVGRMVKNRREIQDRLLGFFANRRVPALDLLPGAKLKPAAYFLPSDQHFTVAGHAFAGGEIARAILDNNLLPRRAGVPAPEEAPARKGRVQDG